jgi:hypothetical protein
MFQTYQAPPRSVAFFSMGIMCSNSAREKIVRSWCLSAGDNVEQSPLVQGEGYAVIFVLIPNPIDQNPWAHWRSPMDMMRQG